MPVSVYIRNSPSEVSQDALLRVSRRLRIVFCALAALELSAGILALYYCVYNVLHPSVIRDAVLLPALLSPSLGVLGSLSCLLSLIAVFSSVRRIGHNRTLYITIAILVLLAILKVTYGIAVWFGGISPRDSLNKAWHSNWPSDLRADIQSQLQCCGYNDASDFPAILSDICPSESGVGAKYGGCIDKLADYASVTRRTLYEPVFGTIALDVALLLAAALLMQARLMVERWQIRANRMYLNLASS
ncbi:hypothetical protein GQ42DRAFT_172466 [Ramicandelaber brevisporus]|nr:hypothetical protein GQ42DRAFT_172466 [Ramicandelaber brevisporus]